MRRKQFTILVTVVVLVSAFVGAGMQSACAATPSASANNGVEIVSFSTDKDIYSAKENMDVFLSVYSPKNITNAVITVSGVKSTKGVYYVSYSQNHNLTTGTNNISFTKTLPSCSSCAGISQGTYSIEASVTSEGEVVKATHSIAITSQPDQVITVNIDVEEAKRMSDSEELIILDVRPKEAYDQAHVEGALSIPLSNLSNRTIEFNTSDKIVVFSENGSDSTIACDLLIKNGSKRVYNVLGGIDTWNASNYTLVPTETSTFSIPGFEAALSIATLCVVAYRIKRRRFW